MSAFSINSKAYHVAGDLTPMNIAKAVHREEGDRVSVDALAEKVKRAAHLISYCGERLRSTESEVQKVLDELGEDA